MSRMTNDEGKNLIHKMVLGLGDTPKEFETQSIIDIKEALNLAIKALEERDDLLERAYGHVVGQGTKGVIRDIEVTENDK